MATTSPHKNSLSFLIYSVVAASLWCLYYSFTQIINATLTYFVIDPTGEGNRALFFRPLFSLNYSESATLLFVGGALLCLVRALECHAFSKHHIDTASGPRIWTLRLILLAAGLSIVFDFYRIVSSYLSGNSDLLNLLHVFITFFVGLLIVLFVSRQLSERFMPPSHLLTPQITGFIALMLGAVTLSIYITPPALMRDLHMDARRLDKMSQINYKMKEYYYKNKKLPTSLKDLLDADFNVDKITDTSTQSPLEYNILTPDSFEMCAIFLKDASQMRLYRQWPANNFKHKAGHACQAFTIEKAPPRSAYSDS